MKPIDTRRPSRLDLNAPLLSARRSNLVAMSNLGLSRSNSLNGACDRVPFVWEQSPGKPKDNASIDSVLEVKALPLPKPPRIRWQEEWPTLAFLDGHGFNGNTDEDDDEEESDEEKEDDKGEFSDVIDLFSLIGSLHTTSERERHEEDENESNSDNKNGSLSPSFMIERFLPAATALAASSLSALASDKQIHPMYASSNTSTTSKEGPCIPRVAGEAYSSSKGCGLENLFSWRVKHRVCGVKSPVRQPRSRPKP